MTSETPQTSQSGTTVVPAPTKVARLRLDRSAKPAPSVTATIPPAILSGRDWATIRSLRTDAATMRRHKLFVDSSDDEVTRRFDLLRTLLTGAIEEHGILRLGVTAPTSGSGTSFIAANLALSMARRPSARVLLADMNLRDPGLARLFGANAPGPLAEILSGSQPITDQLRLFGGNLALLLNTQAATGSAEILQEPATGEALRDMRHQFAPTIEIYDLPPVLGADDTLSFLPQLDGVLMVADGTRNTASQLRAAEELLTGRTRLVAVILNRGEIRRSLAEIIQNIRPRWLGGRRKG
ncbi:CpsD/CapB family tyrosine-protein kinase [Paracoccus spongiarum]|uniref:CpsD/CapB family tyrosine-protein kinase n=1 Tax=Paracoccus spongiarum TaxID=3064387 RepID=A0ABT9J856_9RHOB|nr:CpsD/CapB family tyrosine-protein kinase [Paracoccus sp. 2205BS29-5]MDP5306003.1 CpsD/CapB family tyrosine-protein kinase [Paracoccus sp. 2205BS29-5]